MSISVFIVECYSLMNINSYFVPFPPSRSDMTASVEGESNHLGSYCMHCRVNSYSPVYAYTAGLCNDFVSESVRLCVCAHLILCTFCVCVSVHLSCASVCLCIWVCASVHLSLCICASESVRLCVCASESVCLCVCVHLLAKCRLAKTFSDFIINANNFCTWYKSTPFFIPECSASIVSLWAPPLSNHPSHNCTWPWCVQCICAMH